MDKEQAIEKGLKLVGRLPVAMLGTLDEEGRPWIKAMLNIATDGLKHAWFSTGSYSRRVAQLQKDPRASVYFLDQVTYEGLLMLGTMEVLDDPETKERFWVEGFEKYYPGGVQDPDYVVLKFTTSSVNYYHGLSNITFDV